MYLPKNIELPFFAYGFFKPGELSYHQIENYVDDDIPPKETSAYGSFYEKDGVPVLRLVSEETKHSKKNTVKGYVIHFRKEIAEEAYQCICNMEPYTLYQWQVVPLKNGICNVLTARVDYKTNEVEGAIENTADFHDWHCINDPLLDVGMEYLKYQYFIPLVDKEMPFCCGDTRKLLEKLREKGTHGPHMYIELFTLQMGYVFLWTILDRYKSLKYGLNLCQSTQNSNMANDFIWSEVVKKICFLLDRNGEKKLLRKVPESRMAYYPNSSKSSKFLKSILLNNLYNVRCNAVHRGKAVIEDRQLLRDAFLLLYVIMSYIITYDVKHKKDEAEKQLKEDCQAIKKLLTPV